MNQDSSTATSADEAAASIRSVDAVVIGAGFSGLYSVYKLRELGLDVVGIDQGSDVGGTWYWNKYPGARTDSPAQVYCYEFSAELNQEWDWKERYPSQPEMQSYLGHVADRFDLRKHYVFDERVVSAHYNDQSGTWEVSTRSGGQFSARYFVSGAGILSAPNIPSIEGIGTFAGEIHHPGRWPAGGVPATGKSFAVVGTSSTGIQVLPHLAADAEQVYVLQRTPNYVVPAQNRDLTDTERRDFKKRYEQIWKRVHEHPFAMPFDDPNRAVFDVDEDERLRIYEEAWQKGGFHFLFESFSDLPVDAKANETACEFVRSKIRSIVKDPAVAELLCPTGYPYGAKRPPSGTNYYETFNRQNVTLVDIAANPIEKIVPEGIVVNGELLAVDAIVFATGFDAVTGSLGRIDIRGQGGISLKDKWSQGPLTNLGLSTNGFPNFFMVAGPLSPFSNAPVAIEDNVNWIAACIRFLADNDYHSIMATAEAERSWADHVTAQASEILASQGERVNTWFAGANVEGKAHAINLYFGGADFYSAECAKVAANGYEGFVLA
jgi:cation diffusion facilitator CzcD-associated flavoprotein CzcO